ncbi:HicB family protein [Candidatus Roizmanbacteria bacterium CG_4_10_14_3_um_filter_39_13]|uniref:HicB family protein n=4 Tax=Candidatus Roizmaniibacteriota TaxID=1752723 RepID=A0A2H0KJ53_9BACT|nr:MAG: HicB family protein [Candidatus Roizmanbacteria bacterium CG11_big_fil_rev_8_21_14_0_20_37_16]PIV08009.1 MAG: HicB family protein [Candidatus Roizmanbacteria bacterium CG03_land_8_20_14_0_80_39_12]PIV70775.1 MAG: HicB family protein [Candidatus Roizmanbacteria bacterium CG17_big_fil_post_rev_8_21_14_2_50_39_7]PIX68715.1 MAG: HicB family protein [Candidatus Roizmanbacteria bacterium CG_4_10_14_3_um_filter_39_13]
MEKHVHFNIVVSQDEDGVFVASCPAIPGCHSQGDTYEEAEKNIKEAIELCLKVAETDPVYKNSIDFGTPETSRFFGISNIMVRLSPSL